MRRKKRVTPNAEKEMTIYKKKEVRRISIKRNKMRKITRGIGISLL
jgi:hypothetical protein